MKRMKGLHHLNNTEEVNYYSFEMNIQQTLLLISLLMIR
jgi:hypothetical protein